MTFGLPELLVILAITFFMSHGARNWPFLTLIGLPVSAAAIEQVGLTAEEGGYLQNVNDFGDFSALLGQVHVGDDRHADFLADLFEDRGQTISRSRRRASCRDAGAVGLVEAGFVNEARAGALEHVAQELRRFERVARGSPAGTGRR